MRPSGVRAARIVAIAVAAGMLRTASLAAAKWKEPTEAEKQIAEDPAKGLMGAVYLEKTQRSESQEFYVYVRAKILSKAGFDIGAVELNSDSRAVEGRTISPTGKVTELSSKDVRRITKVKAAGSNEEKVVFTMPALEPGCFIEYAYKEWGWLGSAESYHIEILFQDKYPVKRQELRTPVRFPYASTIRSTQASKVRFQDQGSEIVYESTNAPPLDSEPYSLPRNERSAGIVFAYAFADVRTSTADEFWKDGTRKVFVPLLKRVLVRPGKVEAVLKRIEGSRAADPEARLRAIYRWVQSSLKNELALPAGETSPKGGWKKNEDAGDSLEHGAGTPWDLVAVCASLLRADGWKFRSVFTPDVEERYFHREIPSFFQFNGWIIEVKNQGLKETVYLAFDHPLLAFGQMPWSRAGTEGFAIDPETEATEVVRVPATAADRNLRRRTWTIAVDAEGTARTDRKTTLSGFRAFEERSALFRSGKPADERAVRESFQKLTPPGELESISYENAEASEGPVVVATRFARPGIATTLPGGRILLSPLALLSQTNPFTQEKRAGPISFPYAYRDEDTVTIVPPPGYALEGLPPGTDRTTQAGRYTVAAARGEGESVVVTRLFEVTRFFSGPELFSSYRMLFETAAGTDPSFSLVFRRTDAKKAS
jgi:hypothetical protein